MTRKVHATGPPRRIPSPRELCRFRRNLLRWYGAHGRRFPWRRPSASQYQIIIAEVMLQRTRAETVAAFFPNFMRRFPSWKELSSANDAQLQSVLKPLGLWRRRSSSIRRLAQEMASRNSRFPKGRSEIESLPGIGQYIANAVQLFCHHSPQPLLDINMARVLERVFGPRKLADIRYDPLLQELAGRFVRCKTPARINWAILDMAATICMVKNPRCNECPLAAMCLSSSG